MKVIVLEGLPNKGKTSTLNLVYNILLQNGNSNNKQPLGGDPNDFSDIVDWNNKRIAFFTMGDYSTYLSNAIYGYNNQQCDVLICALSTDTPKIRANNALNYFNATRINKRIAINNSLESQMNSNDAQTIYNLI